MSVTISYCQSRLAALGITPEMNRAVFRYGTKDKEEGFFQADPHDNIRILYLDPDGVQASYLNERGANRPYYRLRLKTPVGDNKYKTPAKATALPFIPPQVLQKVKLGMRIDTLFLTEGEFKAFAGCMHGMDCLGTSGIFHFKNGKKRELHPWILQIVEVCRVSNIVFLYDSDATNLYSDMARVTPETLVTRDAAKRPGNFCASMKLFKECCKHTELDAFVSIIHQQHKLKGLDDLFAGLPNEASAIAEDALLLSKSSGYFFTLSLHDFSNFKINAFHGLNTIEEFYEKHREVLRHFEFNFRESIYRFNPDTHKVELSETNFEPFWEFDNNNCKINLRLCFDLLHQHGFRLYRIELGNYLIVRVEENIVDLIDTKQVKDFLIQYISQIKHLAEPVKMQVQNTLLAYSNIFSMQMLNVLQCITDNFQEDSSDCMLFYYQNGFVEVTKDCVSLKPYSELKKYVWRSQVIKRNYTEIDADSLTEFNFNKFLWTVASSIAGQKTDLFYNSKGEAFYKHEQRFYSLCSIIGYLMHTAKKERKAVLLTDMNINDNPEGRTGKNLITRALSYMRAHCGIDGKNYKPDNQFRFQEASIFTKVLSIDDAGSGRQPFDFEHLFSAITEGVQVEKKGQPRFTIHPSVLISSNRAIEIKGGSAKARVIEYEIANFFSWDYTPQDLYKEWFFDDWKDAQWNSFDTLMLECAKIYLDAGVIKAGFVNLSLRKLLEGSSRNDDLIKFLDAEFAVPADYYSRKGLCDKFKHSNDYPKLDTKRFMKWVGLYCEHFHIKILDAGFSAGDRRFSITKMVR